MTRNVPVVQVAFSVRDQRAARRWYQEVLGYIDAGQLELPAPEPGEPSSVGELQGVPGAVTDVYWAVDQQELFQLEWFQYRHPTPPEPDEPRRLSDIGYGMVSFHVPDLDATLARAKARQCPPLTDPVGAEGDRRVCLHDPDGILLELMEADPRTPTPVARPRAATGAAVARSVTVSVPDLDRSLRFFVETLGMQRADDVQLHTAEHEELWGLGGGLREAVVVWSGDFWLELVHYNEPVGAPWRDGHSLSDFGILNIALGPRTFEEYKAVLGSVVAGGYRANREYIVPPDVAANYTVDDQGFSVELLYAAPSMHGSVGFLPIAEG
jgi:catechol 2,3-dioxygenase-like lactoylglutathione lyase family enzyme